MEEAVIRGFYFHYQTKNFIFRHRTQLKAFLLAQLHAEGKEVDTINYIFCNDGELLKLNQEHLGHNTYTDIITFELSGKGLPLLADIYISIDRLKENASLYRSPFVKELHRVIFHGALHLIGYKDKELSQAKLMRKLEDKWLASYFVPREKNRIKY